MKKLLLFIFLSVVTVPLNAYNVLDLGTLTVVECDNLPSYEKKVEKSALSYTITYSFDSIAVVTDVFSSDKVVPYPPLYGRSGDLEAYHILGILLYV